MESNGWLRRRRYRLDVEAVRRQLRCSVCGRSKSQAELAREVGVSHATLSRLFSGVVEQANPETLEGLARVLGCDIRDIVLRD